MLSTRRLHLKLAQVCKILHAWSVTFLKISSRSSWQHTPADWLGPRHCLVHSLGLTITTTHLSPWPSTTGVLVFPLTPYAWLLVLPLTLPWLLVLRLAFPWLLVFPLTLPWLLVLRLALPWLLEFPLSNSLVATGAPSCSPMATGAPSHSHMPTDAPSHSHVNFKA